jgi:cysteine desulfurase
MWPYFTEHYGNAASRDHSFGWTASEAVETARSQVAALVGADPADIVFTSGATESVNLALKGVAAAAAGKGNHLITCRTEHKAVLDTCAFLEENGCRVSYLDPPGEDETAFLETLEKLITPQTICIALMYANNETGVLGPVREASALARRHGVSFFSDATQAAGKTAVDVDRDAIDLMAFSAHKIYGPKGAGALYVRQGDPAVRPRLQMHGGGHEKGLRSGTLNVPAIVGFGEAASLCLEHMHQEGLRLQDLRDRMEQGLLDTVAGASVNGPGRRLPHVTNLLFPGIDSEQLLLSVSSRLALSRGSACSSNSQKPSHVLTAIGLSGEQAQQSVRISLGRFTTEEEVFFALDILRDAWQKGRPGKHAGRATATTNGL